MITASTIELQDFNSKYPHLNGSNTLKIADIPAITITLFPTPFHSRLIPCSRYSVVAHSIVESGFPSSAARPAVRAALWKPCVAHPQTKPARVPPRSLSVRVGVFFSAPLPLRWSTMNLATTGPSSRPPPTELLSRANVHRKPGFTFVWKNATPASTKLADDWPLVLPKYLNVSAVRVL